MFNGNSVKDDVLEPDDDRAGQVDGTKRLPPRDEDPILAGDRVDVESVTLARSGEGVLLMAVTRPGVRVPRIYRLSVNGPRLDVDGRPDVPDAAELGASFDRAMAAELVELLPSPEEEAGRDLQWFVRKAARLTNQVLPGALLRFQRRYDRGLRASGRSEKVLERVAQVLEVEDGPEASYETLAETAIEAVLDALGVEE
jgi:hypothetical protein